MKKFMALAVAVVLAVASLAACGCNKKETANDEVATGASDVAVEMESESNN